MDKQGLLANQKVVGKKKRRPWLFLILPSLFLILASSVLVSFKQLQPTQPDEPRIVQEVAAPSPLPSIPKPAIFRTIQGKIKRNQTFYDIMIKNGMSPQDVELMASSAKGVFNLRKLMPGRSFEIALSDEAKLHHVKYSVGPEKTLVLEKIPDGYEAYMETHPFERYMKRAEGVIESSLFEAIHAMGEGPELAVKLSEIFAWDIDFHFDIRQGDSFSILFEEKWREGSFYGYGRILAAEFVNQGESLRAVYYERSDGKGGYYTPSGKSLQKQFLRSPLKFSRISSKFTYKRYHPVLKRFKPHLGVDYVAPVGTPIHAAGDGKIIFAGRKGQNGKFVKIRHNQIYMTGYLHLSRIAKGIKSGKKVEQGQIIGYVGQTGLATGPHLCYRFYKYGKFVNPLTVKFPSATPVPKEERDIFSQISKSRLNRLIKRPPSYLADRNGYLVAGISILPRSQPS